MPNPLVPQTQTQVRPPRGLGRRRGLVALVAGLTLTGEVAAQALAPRPGTPVWRQARSLRRQLPGHPVGDPGALDAVLEEALAAPYVVGASEALRGGDLLGAAASLSRLVHGVSGAMTMVEAWREVARAEVPAREVAGALPGELDHTAYARWAGQAPGLPTESDADRLRQWFQALEARVPDDVDVSPPELAEMLAPGTLSGIGLAALLPEVPGGGPLGAPPARRRAARREYLRTAWARRLALQQLAARGRAARERLSAAVDRLRIRVTARVHEVGGGPVDGLAATLAGGRLGTALTADGGRFELEAALRRAGQVMDESGILALQLVRNRVEVRRRELPVGRFLAGRASSRGVLQLDLGKVSVPPAEAEVEVQVKGWTGELEDDEGDPQAVRGEVRLVGAAAPQELDEAGLAPFPRQRPGLVMATLAVKLQGGSIVERAFAFGRTKPGETQTLSMALPEGEVELPEAGTSLWRVKHTMKKLSARYRAGEIPRSVFRRAIGEIYRNHRDVYPESPNKSRAFAKQAAAAMREVLKGVEAAREGLRIQEHLDEVSSQLADLRELLPETLRSQYPARRLEEYVRQDVGNAFEAGGGGDYLSVVHLRLIARRARDAISELRGLVAMIVDVVGPRLDKIEARLEQVLEALKADFALSRVAGGPPLEVAVREVMTAELEPLRELVVLAEDLTTSGAVEDLTARATQVEARAGARQAALKGLRRAAQDLLAEARAGAEVAGRQGSSVDAEVATWASGFASTSGGEAAQALASAPFSRGLAEPRALAAALRAVAPMVAADQAYAHAEAARSVHDELIKRSLRELWEMDADAADLQRLAELHPTLRGKELRTATDGMFMKRAAPPPPAPPFSPGTGEGVGRRLAQRARAYLDEERQLAPWVQAARERLAQVPSGQLARADALAQLEALAAVRAGLEPSVRPPTPNHGDPLPGELRAKLEALEATLKQAAEPPADEPQESQAASDATTAELGAEDPEAGEAEAGGEAAPLPQEGAGDASGPPPEDAAPAPSSP